MRKKQLTLILFVVLLNVYRRTWKDIPKYWKSLVYVSFVNSLYYFLFKKRLLWDFNAKGMNQEVLRRLHVFFVTPLLVLACLSKFPTTIGKQILHVVKWTLASCIVEQVVLKNKMIFFKYGWSTFWSGMIYVAMYGLSYLYIKKPGLTWIISFFTLIFFMVKFKLPLATRFLKKALLN